MQYFVSIENRPYHHWQIELLIESFKMRNLDHELVIGVNEFEEKPSIFDIRNITEHKSKIYYNQPFHPLFGMIAAQEEGLLKQPFAFIHPDMLLIQPIVLNNENNLTFHLRNYPDEKLTKTLDYFPQNIPRIELGGIIVFQDTPISFFYDAWNKAKELQDKVPDCIRGGLVTAYLNHSNEVSIGVDEFESTLWQESLEKKSFLHYRHGFPPYFHKKNFYWDELFLSEDFPYENILKLHSNLNVSHMKNIVKSYLKIHS